MAYLEKWTWVNSPMLETPVLITLGPLGQYPRCMLLSYRVYLEQVGLYLPKMPPEESKPLDTKLV